MKSIVPTNLTIDAKKFVQAVATEIKSSVTYAYPGNSLDSSRCHAALQSVKSSANNLSAFVDALKEIPLDGYAPEPEPVIPNATPTIEQDLIEILKKWRSRAASPQYLDHAIEIGEISVRDFFDTLSKMFLAARPRLISHQPETPLSDSTPEAIYLIMNQRGECLFEGKRKDFPGANSTSTEASILEFTKDAGNNLYRKLV